MRCYPAAAGFSSHMVPLSAQSGLAPAPCRGSIHVR